MASLEHISSLYLSYTSVNDPYLADLVSNLFTAIAPYLHHLVIDMPLRDYNHADQPTAAPTIRNAFSKLTRLESFCSVRDECFLPATEPQHNVSQLSVWHFWPNLRSLALYNQDTALDDFWCELGKRKHLETLVLTRADGLGDGALIHGWATHLEKRRFEIVLVDVDYGGESWTWPLVAREDGPKGQLRITILSVPTSYYGDEDEIELCQEWVKRRVLKGIKPAGWDSVEW